MPVDFSLQQLKNVQSIAELEKNVQFLINYYGVKEKELPDFIQDRLKHGRRLRRVDSIRILAGVVIDKAFTYCLSMWSTKKARGPLSPENLESKAKGADRLAKLNVSKGNEKAAQKQLEKARDLREKALELRQVTGSL